MLALLGGVVGTVKPQIASELFSVDYTLLFSRLVYKAGLLSYWQSQFKLIVSSKQLLLSKNPKNSR